MNRMLRALAVLALGLWMGWVIGVFVTASSLFANESGRVPDSTTAADILGPLFNKMYLGGWLALLFALGMIVAAWLRKGLSQRAFIAAAACIGLAMAASIYAGIPVNQRLMAIRTYLKEKHGGYHLAPKDDLARKEFGKLHGISMLMTTVALVAAGGALTAALEIRNGSKDRED